MVSGRVSCAKQQDNRYRGAGVGQVEALRAIQILCVPSNKGGARIQDKGRTD